MGILEEKKIKFIKYLENKANTLLQIRYSIVGFLVTINIAIFAGLYCIYYGSSTDKIYIALFLSIISIIINLIISKVFFREHYLSTLMKDYIECYYENDFDKTKKEKEFYEIYKKQLIERDKQYRGLTFKLIRALLIFIIIVNLTIGVVICSNLINNIFILAIILAISFSLSIVFLMP